MNIEKYIRDVPNYPKDGILFKDITPLLTEPEAFNFVINLMCEVIASQKVDALVGIESRGFIFASPIAENLKLPLALARKPGKLPAEKHSVEYALEYGTNKLEMHKDSLEKGMRVAIIDDLLATGGTAEAAAKLVSQCGAETICYSFLIELQGLSGRERLPHASVSSLLLL